MNSLRIIVVDIEIIPNLSKALKYWPRLSSKFKCPTLTATVSSICCIGWKVVGEKETHCINAWDFPEWKKDVNDDRAVLRAFLEVMKDSHAIVTHNGKRFDKKYIQTRLAVHEMNFLENDPHIDTKALASSNFFFLDNKLQTLGEELFGERKLEHEGWDLWVKTHSRDPKAMALMEKYCKQDVKLTEKVYKRFRPVAKGIPNHNLFDVGQGDKDCCSRCGSTRLKHNGYRSTTTLQYKRLKCADCGASDRTDVRGLMPRAV